MKNKANPFFAIWTLILMMLLTASLAAGAADSKAPQSSAALAKARKARLTTAKFDGLPLSIVISMLQEESVKRDPAGKGVTISLGPDVKELADTEIHLDLKDVSLAEALGRIADSAGLEVQANDTELVLVRKKGKH